MSYYEDYDDDIDEPFFENDDCTDTLNQLKVEIEQSVKQEIKEELAYLRKENEELKDIKKKFDVIKTEYDKKQREMDETIKNTEQKFAKIKLNELMKLFAFEAWGIGSNYVYLPKCNKCDGYRNVKVQLPSGNMVKDACTVCGKQKERYYPERNTLHKITDRYDLKAHYLQENHSDCFEFDTAVKYLKTVEEAIKMNACDIYSHVIFRTKEEAQKVCDILNNQNGITPEWIYTIDGKVLNEFKETNNNGQ